MSYVATLHKRIGRSSFLLTARQVAWIKAGHFHKAMVPEWSEPRTIDQQVAASAFKLADECGCWSWERKEALLKTLYDALRGTTSDWVKDEDRVSV